MSDEIKTENVTQTETQTKNSGDSGITLSQDKLNSLINEKYKKGAEKAKTELLETLGVESVDELQAVINAKREKEEAEKSELEKAQETINKLTNQVEDTDRLIAQMKEESTLSALALQNGVQDMEYFKYAYSQAKNSEGFDADTFMSGLKESKPYVFGNTVATPPTDKTSNNGESPNDLASKVKGMSLSELQALQNTI